MEWPHRELMRDNDGFNYYMYNGERVYVDEYGRDMPVQPQWRGQQNMIRHRRTIRQPPIRSTRIRDLGAEDSPPPRSSNSSRSYTPSSVAMGTALTLALLASVNEYSEKQQRLSNMSDLKAQSKKLKVAHDELQGIRAHIQKMPGQDGDGILDRKASVRLEGLTTKVFGAEDAPSVLRRLSKPAYRSQQPPGELREGGDGSIYTKEELDRVQKALDVNRKINEQQKLQLQSQSRKLKQQTQQKRRQNTQMMPHTRSRHQQRAREARGSNRKTQKNKTSRK